MGARGTGAMQAGTVGAGPRRCVPSLEHLGRDVPHAAAPQLVHERRKGGGQLAAQGQLQAGDAAAQALAPVTGGWQQATPASVQARSKHPTAAAATGGARQQQPRRVLQRTGIAPACWAAVHTPHRCSGQLRCVPPAGPAPLPNAPLTGLSLFKSRLYSPDRKVCTGRGNKGADRLARVKWKHGRRGRQAGQAGRQACGQAGGGHAAGTLGGKVGNGQMRAKRQPGGGPGVQPTCISGQLCARHCSEEFMKQVLPRLPSPARPWPRPSHCGVGWGGGWGVGGGKWGGARGT